VRGIGLGINVEAEIHAAVSLIDTSLNQIKARRPARTPNANVQLRTLQ
jgi:hypothetical protein